MDKKYNQRYGVYNKTYFSLKNPHRLQVKGWGKKTTISKQYRKTQQR